MSPMTQNIAQKNFWVQLPLPPPKKKQRNGTDISRMLFQPTFVVNDILFCHVNFVFGRGPSPYETLLKI